MLGKNSVVFTAKDGCDVVTHFLAAAVTPAVVVDRKATLDAINALLPVTTKHNKDESK